jgi:hypothetical protein
VCNPKNPTLPTPKKGRRPPWEAIFLKGLAETCNVKLSCDRAGIHRDTAYSRRAVSPEFAERWDDAIDDGVDALEEVARRRAFEGSDTLLIFLLKAHRPERYRDNYDLGKVIDRFRGVATQPKQIIIPKVDERVGPPPRSNGDPLSTGSGKELETNR